MVIIRKIFKELCFLARAIEFVLYEEPKHRYDNLDAEKEIKKEQSNGLYNKN